MDTLFTRLFASPQEKSQIAFSNLQDKVNKLYNELISLFTWREIEENRLKSLQNATTAFREKNAGLLVFLDDVQEEKHMKINRTAYRLIPPIDTALVLFPLLTVVELEWTKIPMFQYPLAIFLGYFFSLIGRWVANGIIKTGKNKKWVYLTILIIPAIYWINWGLFDNSSLIFTLVFSLISAGIQSINIYFFLHHHQSVSYFIAKKRYKELQKAEERQRTLLSKQILSLSTLFNVNLRSETQKLYTIYQTHTQKFNNPPIINLSQIQCFIYNVKFFGHDAFPLRAIGNAVLVPSNPYGNQTGIQIDPMLYQDLVFIYNLLAVIGQGDEFRLIINQLDAQTGNLPGQIPSTPEPPAGIPSYNTEDRPVEEQVESTQEYPEDPDDLSIW